MQYTTVEMTFMHAVDFLSMKSFKIKKMYRSVLKLDVKPKNTADESLK